jgi:hypothetical protein
MSVSLHGDFEMTDIEPYIGQKRTFERPGTNCFHDVQKENPLSSMHAWLIFGEAKRLVCLVPRLKLPYIVLLLPAVIFLL